MGLTKPLGSPNGLMFATQSPLLYEFSPYFLRPMGCLGQ